VVLSDILTSQIPGLPNPLLILIVSVIISFPLIHWLSKLLIVQLKDQISESLSDFLKITHE
jgi:hypothetical protein